MDDCNTEEDILGRIYEEVLAFSKRLTVVEESLTFLVKAFRNHNIRITSLENDGTPIPGPSNGQ